MRQVIIHHSADFDGLFCREVAKQSLPEAEVIGWDFNDKVLNPIDFQNADIYILDLPVDKPFGFDFEKTLAFEQAAFLKNFLPKITWIDHHISSIQSHPSDIRGYRINGVAACRLAYQYFLVKGLVNSAGQPLKFPELADYGIKKADGTRTDCRVIEPLSVKLAGQYDIWDKETPWVDKFQYGLKTVELGPIQWKTLLDFAYNEAYVSELIQKGELALRYQKNVDSEIIKVRSFLVKWEGLTFLAATSMKCSSLTFEGRDVPETGHDALMGFFFDGTKWRFSLYHAKHRTDLNLSLIAKKYGGGGHAGSCGFSLDTFPFSK